MNKRIPTLAMRYDAYPPEISDAELAQYFSLSPRDVRAILTRRGDHHRLGWALHLCCLRWLGRQVTTFVGLPVSAIVAVAHQLNIAPTVLSTYAPDQRRWQYHAADPPRGQCGGARPKRDVRAEDRQPVRAS